MANATVRISKEYQQEVLKMFEEDIRAYWRSHFENERKLLKTMPQIMTSLQAFVAKAAYQSHVYEANSGMLRNAAPFPASEWKWDGFLLRYQHPNGTELLCDLCSDYAVTVGYVHSGAAIQKARCRVHATDMPWAPVPAPNAVPVQMVKTPVAKAEPEMCWERYSGIECQCSKQHRLPGSRR